MIPFQIGDGRLNVQFANGRTFAFGRTSNLNRPHGSRYPENPWAGVGIGASKSGNGHS